MSLSEFLLYDGKAPPPEEKTAQKEGVATLSRLRDEYLAIHRESLEPNTLSGIETHFKHFMDSLGEDFPVGTLTLSHLQEHATRRSKITNAKGVAISPVTIRKDFVALRAAWNWGVHSGMLSGAFPPIKRIRLPKVEEKPPFMTRDEVERRVGLGGLTESETDALWECLYLQPDEVKELLAFVRETSPHPWLYPMVCTVAHTGARRSELIRMEAGDVDVSGAGEVTIRERKRVHGAKTTRRVKLTPFLKDVMREWLLVRPKGKFLFAQEGVVQRSKKRSLTTGHQSEPSRAKSLAERKATVRIREIPGASPLTQDEASDHFDRVLSSSKWDVLNSTARL